MSSQASLSLIGLGAMGLPMARILSEHGPLTVWNRSVEKTRLVPQASAVATVAEAAAEVVVTVLPDLQDVRDVLFDGGLLEAFQQRRIQDPIVVVCGTVSPVALRALASELSERGVHIVDAPLSGGVLGAAEGRLSIMVGGSREHYEAVNRVLAPCANAITHMGATGAGSAAKLCNQLVVAQTVTALSEAFLLARSAGIAPDLLASALGAGLADSEVLRQKSHHWIQRSFEPGGTIEYQLKDLRYATEVAEASGLRLEALAATLALFERASSIGHGGLDHTGIYRTISGE